MFSGDTTPYFYHNSQLFNETFNIPGDDQIPSSPPPTAAASISVHSHPVLLYNLSILKEKIQQLQSFVGLAAAAGEMQPESAAAAVSGAATAIQEIISAASSMMFAFQQVAIGEERQQQSTSNNIYTTTTTTTSAIHEKCIGSSPTSTTTTTTTATACDIIELDAADLLAKFTHYCHVCGKGFKRDANLRMHMRAHGDEYKTNLALTKHYTTSTTTPPPPPPPPVPPSPPRKYSCPHEGCRWNKKHAKFQPLKSMVCVKNHYKRSHCPKMYVCNRCNRKQFSVLSDLKTHEKHCGNLSWMCTCGTTFSRKDKLMGHVTLFVGHEPVVSCLAKQGKVEKGELEMQMDFS